MKDPAFQLRTATRRAKSDVANKLVSMCLHELSRTISKGSKVRVDGEEYEGLVRQCFENRCPYCSRVLAVSESVIEHLDGMNRARAGLHIPGNVLVACRKCNGEKRRDDSLEVLLLASSGWESFLSHDGSRCAASCRTCLYWETVWGDSQERKKRMLENIERIRLFRGRFPEGQALHAAVIDALPALLAKLYSDCQVFAETEIKSLLTRLGQLPGVHL